MAAKKYQKRNKDAVEEAIQDMKFRSLEEEINRDQLILQEVLNRPRELIARRKVDSILDLSPKDLQILKDEKERIDVLKRLLILIGGGNLSVSCAKINPKNKKYEDDDEYYRMAKLKHLPLCFFLSGHGVRVVVNIPKGSGNKLFNWITSGKVNKLGVSAKHNCIKAKREGFIFFNQRYGQYALSIKKDGTVKERKAGLIYKLFVDIIPSFFGEITRNWGAHVAMGGYKEEDINGNTIEPRGGHGNLYIYYQKPTSAKNGALMFGIESTSPSVEKGVIATFNSHSIVGRADVLTASGGAMIEELILKLSKDDDENYCIPKKYNGLKIILDTNTVNKFVNLDADSFSADMISMHPSRTIEEFEDQFEELEEGSRQYDSNNISRTADWVNKYQEEDY